MKNNMPIQFAYLSYHTHLPHSDCSSAFSNLLHRSSNQLLQHYRDMTECCIFDLLKLIITFKILLKKQQANDESTIYKNLLLEVLSHSTKLYASVNTALQIALE